MNFISMSFVTKCPWKNLILKFQLCLRKKCRFCKQLEYMMTINSSKHWTWYVIIYKMQKKTQIWQTLICWWLVTVGNNYIFWIIPLSWKSNPMATCKVVVCFPWERPTWSHWMCMICSLWLTVRYHCSQRVLLGRFVLVSYCHLFDFICWHSCHTRLATVATAVCISSSSSSIRHKALPALLWNINRLEMPLPDKTKRSFSKVFRQFGYELLPVQWLTTVWQI